MHKLESVIGPNFARMCGLELQKPARATEFEVQAWLWNALKAAGADVRGEVTVRGTAGFPGEKRGRFQCRFDLVIFESDAPVHIVEVKTARQLDDRARNALENTRQARRYVAFGVPVTFVFGMDDAQNFARNWRANADVL